MLTVLVGLDTNARAKRLETLLAPMRRHGADIRTYTDVNFSVDAVRDTAQSQSLFGDTIVSVLSGVADTAELRDAVESLIPVLVESPHQFIIVENAFLVGFLRKVESKKGIVEKFDLKEKPKKEEVFNSFLLTDAFSDRKRSLAWPLYRKAISLGVEPRELHGKIYWVVKSMLVAGNARTASDSGLNPFVYQKAKRGAEKFAREELMAMLEILTTMYHETLVSGIDMETALESFLLRVLAK